MKTKLYLIAASIMILIACIATAQAAACISMKQVYITKYVNNQSVIVVDTDGNQKNPVYPSDTLYFFINHQNYGTSDGSTNLKWDIWNSDDANIRHTYTQNTTDKPGDNWFTPHPYTLPNWPTGKYKFIGLIDPYCFSNGYNSNSASVYFDVTNNQISHTSKACYNNDIYWYNRDNVKEDIFKDCGDSSCGGWTSNSCSNGNVIRTRLCYDKGCSSGSCSSNTRTDTETVQTCNSLGCIDGKCIIPSCKQDGMLYSCSPRTSSTECCSTMCNSLGFCGKIPDTMSCELNDECKSGHCINNVCAGCSADSDCQNGQYCSNGECKQNIVCQKSTSYCKDADVYTCSSDGTYESKLTECGSQSCDMSQGGCYSNTPVYEKHSYAGCYDKDSYWFDSYGTRQEKKSECGDAYCQGWQDNYCKDGNVVHYRYCYDKGCDSNTGDCIAPIRTETPIVNTCANGCENGACIENEITCDFGWKCFDSSTSAYQNSDCSWSDKENCPSGCNSAAGKCSETKIEQDCTVTGCLAGFACCNNQCIPQTGSACTEIKIDESEIKSVDVTFKGDYDMFIGDFQVYIEDGKMIYYDGAGTKHELPLNNALSFTLRKREDKAVIGVYNPTPWTPSCKDYITMFNYDPICSSLYYTACSDLNFSDTAEVAKSYAPAFAGCVAWQLLTGQGRAQKLSQERYNDWLNSLDQIPGYSIQSLNVQSECDTKFIIQNLSAESEQKEVNLNFEIANTGNCSAKTSWGVFGGENGTDSIGIASIDANSVSKVSTKITYSTKGLHFPLIASDKIDAENDRGVDVYKMVYTDISDCPYACCLNNAGYEDKQCSNNYKCFKNKCIPYG